MSPSDIARLMEPLRRRVMLMVGRGTVGSVADAGGLQTAQVTLLADETHEAAERIQPYGLSANPMPGADALVLRLGGNSDHPIIIGIDDRRARPTGLAGGEVCLYSHQTGHRITLKADRSIEIEGEIVLVKATTKLRIEAPALECTGTITDNCDSGGLAMDTMRSRYNSHTHGATPGPSPTMP